MIRIFLGYFIFLKHVIYILQHYKNVLQIIGGLIESFGINLVLCELVKMRIKLIRIFWTFGIFLLGVILIIMTEKNSP